jgi:DNA repair protein RadC
MNIKRVKLSYEPLTVCDSASPHYGKRITCSRDARTIVEAMILHEIQEVMLVLLLNNKNKVVAVHECASGSTNWGYVGDLAHVKEVLDDLDKFIPAGAK